MALTAQAVQPTFTWAEQDRWKDPRGPMGVDKPSPKLAPLTSESPQWLHDLHRNGVSISFHADRSSCSLIDR
jgi:hypothetical protein